MGKLMGKQLLLWNWGAENSGEGNFTSPTGVKRKEKDQ